LCRSGSGFFGDESPGGYAELVAAAETALVALPDDVSFEVGSILACAVGTAFHAIRTQVGLRVGESILITGATGGVGAHAVQIAKLAGARVIAVTSSPSKMESLLDSGADDVIMTGTHDLANEVRKLTNGEGVDAVLEIVGAATFPASVLSLRPGGRLVFLGNISAESVQLAPGLVIMEELEIKGADACSKNELANVIELVQRSQIRPCIEATFPLEEAGRAHQLLEDRKVTGRIVLSCQA
jgi:NADPH:quinone reductase-like Zn-dependent oxidoreductase